jgi:hypothetical protein
MVLGHYTTLLGLQGIIVRQKLWATNIKFLNDQGEFQHTQELVQDLMTGRVSRGSAADRVIFAVGMFQNLRRFDQFHSDLVFTTSFSEEIDLLSQWRGYCPSNNGYCIVMDAQAIVDTLRANKINAQLLPCLYDASKKRRQLTTLINTCEHRYHDVGDKAFDALVGALKARASYFKDESFAEEREHRIIVTSPPRDKIKVEFRPGRYSLVPYIELDAPRSLIKQIIIGPNENQVLAERALQAFIESVTGVASWLNIDVKIVRSKIPYRI